MPLVGTGTECSYCTVSGLGPTNWSYSLWFKSVSSTTQYPFTLGPSSAALSTDYCALVGGNSVWTGSYKNPAGNAAQADASSFTGGWQHACGFFRSTSHRSVFNHSNGTQKDNTTSVTTDSPDRFVIGENYYNGAFQSSGIIGSIAHLGVWITELSTAEFTALRKGFSPRRMRVMALFGYWPLIKNSNDAKGRAMTDRNSPSFTGDMPRIYW